MGSRRASWATAATKGLRWTAAQGRAAVTAWAQSGESMQGFARRHGLTAQRLAWWRDRIRDAEGPGEAAVESSSLLPVTVREPDRGGGGPAVVVVIGATRVEVTDPYAVPPSWVVAVVAGLEEPRG